MVKRKEPEDESSTVELRRSTRVRKAPKSYFEEYSRQDYLTLTDDAEPVGDDVEDIQDTDNEIESDVDEDSYDSSFINDDEEEIEDEVEEEEEEEDEFTSDLDSHEEDAKNGLKEEEDEEEEDEEEIKPAVCFFPPVLSEEITQQIIENAIELDLNL